MPHLHDLAVGDPIHGNAGPFHGLSSRGNAVERALVRPVAVLDAWRVGAANAVLQLQANRGDARAELRLFKTALQSDSGLDRGIRAWAAKDRTAAAALRRVDRRRLVYLRSLFRRLGFGPVEATAWAWFVYQALIGESAMDAHARRRERIAQRLEIVYDMLVRKR